MNPHLVDGLREKIGYLERMQAHLEYSHEKIRTWWRVDLNFDEWSPEQLESLTAFRARFAEMQDHLASAMKLIAVIEGRPTEAFTYVLNYMVKLHILDTMEEWQEIRDLRNAATHDYSASGEDKVLHFHRLFQNTHYLIETFTALKRFAFVAYPEKN